MTMRNILLGATMLCAATTPAYAFAQAAAAADETATTQDDAGYEGDIIVTATGRSQIAQDVPIALSVVGGEQLTNSGISDIRGLRQVAPSLQVTTGQSSATGVVLRIRGIGTAGDNPGFEPAVGVFIDGVLRARAGVALADLPPIERVEVLRGPQGTLFGRNTSAGALNIITQKPSFELGGYAELSYGNYDEIEAKAGVTGGLTEKIAARLDGGYHKRDGYIKDANSDRRFNDVDRWFVRGQTLFEGDDVSLRIIGDYAETDEQCCGAINSNSGFQIAPNPADINTVLGFAASNVIQAFSANPALGGAVGRVGIVRPFDPKSRTMAASPNRDLSEQVKEWGVSGELNWDLGGVTLTSITAYRDWKALRNQDIDFSGLDRAYREGYRTGLRDFTQEVRFNGSAFDGGLDWLIGGFYLNEKTTLTDRVRFGTQADQFVDGIFNALTAGQPGLPPQGLQLYGTLGPAVPVFAGVPLPRTPNGGGQVADQYSVKTEAFALFTHNIINISDQLSLTLGLRYNHENKDIKANLNSQVPACNFLQSPAAAAYRAGLGARFPLVYLYACNPTVNSEFNGNYTGDRSESEFTGTAKLSFKVSDEVLLYGGYDRGYKSGGYNLDRGSFDSVFLGGNGAQITDLEFGNETADVYEIGFKTNFSRAFQFNGSVFHSTFKGYQNNAFEGTRFVVRNFDKVISKGVELDAIIRPVSDLNFHVGYTLLDTEVKDPLAGSDNGKPLTNSPRHVITTSATWTPQLSSSVGGLVHIDARTNSDSNTLNSPLGVPFTTNDGYTIVNARVGLNFNDNRFGIEAYVENLFNKYYNITSFPVPEQGTSFAVYPAPPRFYGVKLRASF
ncbi:TonB-dependent receptor [Sphingopyxis sp. H050]|jgi:iron complex outermembrane recepter protein|uniref:TonB-dependent receptor n=1 Tax=Sphingopyxis sp. H050 TaxID=1759072 RepID=UPI000AA4931E|nr:TonB-dependent receptor [Sphingopyxis sp. H050]